MRVFLVVYDAGLFSVVFAQGTAERQAKAIGGVVAEANVIYNSEWDKPKPPRHFALPDAPVTSNYYYKSPGQEHECGYAHSSTVPCPVEFTGQ